MLHLLMEALPSPLTSQASQILEATENVLLCNFNHSKQNSKGATHERTEREEKPPQKGQNIKVIGG